MDEMNKNVAIVINLNDNISKTLPVDRVASS
jgi:hypothetical protein